MRIETYKNWKSGKFDDMSENVRLSEKDVDGLGGKVKFKSAGENTFVITIRRGEKVLNANGVLNPGMSEKLISFLVSNGIYDSSYLQSKVIVYQGEVKGNWRVQKIGAELFDVDPNSGVSGGSMISTAEYGKATSAAQLSNITQEEEQEAEAEVAGTDAVVTELSALKPILDELSSSLPLVIGDGYKSSIDKNPKIKKLQAALNLGFQKGLKLDGGYGPLTNTAASEVLTEIKGTTANISQLSLEDLTAILSKAESQGITVDKIDSALSVITGGTGSTSAPVSDEAPIDDASGGYNFIW